MYRTSQCWALVIALTGLWLVSHGQAVEAAEPEEIIRQMLTRLTAVLTDNTLQDPAQRQERHQRVVQVVAPSFDFAEMARRSLGQYWHRLTPAQQGEFVQIFSDLVLQSLVERIVSRTRTVGYGSVPNAIQYTRETIDPAGDASVQTVMTYANEQTKEEIEYLLLRRNGAWMVYDVVTEGSSMVTNYRAQFALVIRQESYDDLLKRLKASRP